MTTSTAPSTVPQQSSAFGMDKSLMTVATDACVAAIGMEVAPAVMVKFMFTLSSGDAAAVDRAGQDWRQAADLVRQASEALQQAVSGVSGDDWSAKDRDAYEKKVKEAVEQYQVVETFLEAAGIALSVMAAALFAYAVFATAMGVVLAAIGAAIVACEATVVGSAAVPELEEAAAVCLEVTQVATAILAEVGVAIAEVLQGGAMLDATVESEDGNKQALGDLLDGEKVGAAAAGANLVQNAVNGGLAYANRNSDRPTTGKDGEPSTEGNATKVGNINLNADRDWNKNWDVGASGKYGDFSGGADVKFNGDGVNGVSATGGYTPTTGPQVTGSGGWSQDSSGNDHYTGSVTGGYKTDDGSSYSTTASGGYDDNHDGSSKVSGGVTGNYSNTYTGNSASAGANGSYEHGADGSSTYSGGVSGSASNGTGESVYGGETGTYRHGADGGNDYSATTNGGYSTPYDHGSGSVTTGYDQGGGNADDSVYSKVDTTHGTSETPDEKHDREVRYDTDTGRVTGSGS